MPKLASIVLVASLGATSAHADRTAARRRADPSFKKLEGYARAQRAKTTSKHVEVLQWGLKELRAAGVTGRKIPLAFSRRSQIFVDPASNQIKIRPRGLRRLVRPTRRYKAQADGNFSDWTAARLAVALEAPEFDESDGSLNRMGIAMASRVNKARDFEERVAPEMAAGLARIFTPGSRFKLDQPLYDNPEWGQQMTFGRATSKLVLKQRMKWVWPPLWPSTRRVPARQTETGLVLDLAALRKVHDFTGRVVWDGHRK